MLIDDLFDQNCYGMSHSEKSTVFTKGMQELNLWHYQRSPDYRRLIDAYGGAGPSLNEMQPLSTQLFKKLELLSVNRNDVVKVLTSSGTTSQTLSKIYLDQNTSQYQSKALVKILQSFIGNKRLPMLIADTPNTVANRRQFSARGAGVQGLSLFGRKHTWLFDENMRLDERALKMFCERYCDQPVIIFGFTFMVWEYLLRAVRDSGASFSLPHGILLHSGGWKKLQDRSVGTEMFNREAKALLGVNRVHNFYGMVEQTGSIYMECEQGYLHSSIYSDVIIRNPLTMDKQKMGREGVIQVMSLLPRSYPGHNLLTEDLGVIHGVDNCGCGRKGAYFSVLGRLTQSESRGCSDTFS